MEKPNLRGKKIPDKIHSWSPSSVIHRKKFQTKFPSGLLSYTVKNSRQNSLVVPSRVFGCKD